MQHNTKLEGRRNGTFLSPYYIPKTSELHLTLEKQFLTMN